MPKSHESAHLKQPAGFCSSGLQCFCRINQECSSLFIIVINLIFVYSLGCINGVRGPLCQPNCFMCFCSRNYVGTQVEDLSTAEVL